MFGSNEGSGALDPERIIPAATRSMTLMLTAFDELDTATPTRVGDATLDSQLQAWGQRQSAGSDRDTGHLLLGLLAWTRLHGIISLELDGFFRQVGIVPGRLYDIEIDHLIAQRSNHP